MVVNLDKDDLAALSTSNHVAYLDHDLELMRDMSISRNRTGYTLHLYGNEANHLTVRTQWYVINGIRPTGYFSRSLAKSRAQPFALRKSPSMLLSIPNLCYNNISRSKTNECGPLNAQTQYKGYQQQLLCYVHTWDSTAYG
jgi:hypothetical protein